MSWWLAIQTFVGLGIVSVAVYLLTASNLAARQADWLAQKHAAVSHFLEEAESEGDLLALRHKLSDFIAGHDELSLVVRNPDGSVLYQGDLAPLKPMRTRSMEIVLAPARGETGSTKALLTLDTQADDQLLLRLAATLLAAALLGSLAVSAGSFALVRIGLAPVRHLVDQTRKLAADTLSQRLDGSAQPLELQPLIEQFNALLGRLNRAYEQLEGFNADVAHELCTPLTTLISSTELALRKARDIDELREGLGSNLEELHRMAGIVNDMLFLSQADRGAHARREPVASLAAVVGQVIEYHDAALDEAGLRIERVGDAAGHFDLPLIRRALSNLLANATRHADRGSLVRVELATPRKGVVSLCVVNEGQTIDPEHLPRLFDRFYRSDPARSHGDLNHGLGLSIVTAIARMHGGSAAVHSADRTTRVGFELASAEPAVKVASSP